MQSIKTYEQVDRSSHEVSFSISRMQDIFDRRIGMKDEPHRHNFYTVLLVEKANGTHTIDFNDYELRGEQVFFISPGQVHQVSEQEKSYGFAIVFSNQFLVENNIPVSFIEDLNLFNDYGHTPPLSISVDELSTLNLYCEQMLLLKTSQTKYADLAIGSYLKLFLIQCNNVCNLTIENTQQKEAGNSILRNFKNLVNDNFHRWHQTSEYAEALHVSPDHLNRVIKSLVGKTAKEFIQSRITIAAKRLLYFSPLSTKEIAYELGFSEPAHFSSFFKKCTGESPSNYRKTK
jgi:AraC family transcriptional activator of pobA